MVQCYIFLVLQYGLEGSTLIKETMRLETFEMCVENFLVELFHKEQCVKKQEKIRITIHSQEEETRFLRNILQIHYTTVRYVRQNFR